MLYWIALYVNNSVCLVNLLHSTLGQMSNMRVRSQSLRWYKSKRLQLFGHVMYCDAEQDHMRALKAMIVGPPRNWQKPLGRPRQIWLRAVTSDRLPLNLGLNAAWRRDQNRE